MLPTFPKFKKLEITDRPEMEAILMKYPPYSDFSFVSLWSWNVNDNVEISKWNGSLIIKLEDYMDGQFVVSILGVSETAELIYRLLKFVREIEAKNELCLVSEDTVMSLSDKGKLEIVEDRDAFDYLISVDELVRMSWSKLGSMHNHVNHFVKEWRGRFNLFHADKLKEQQKDDIDRMLNLWQKNKRQSDKDVWAEFTAIRRLLCDYEKLNVWWTLLYVEERLAGFSAHEMVHDGYAFIHFEKADISFKGIFSYLGWEVARWLQSKGVKLINREQDLGLSGLREAKMGYRPVGFLKKYRVSLAI